MWYDQMTREIINLLSDAEALAQAEQNWWDDMAVSIANVLRQFAHTLPMADESRMTKAVNDLRNLAATAQNP